MTDKSEPTKATVAHPTMTGRDGAMDYAARLEALAAAPGGGTVHLEDGDDIALQYLGAALVLEWHLIPEAAQRAILQKATEIGGLPALPPLREQIRALVKRNG
jgi:hypothetical protein